MATDESLTLLKGRVSFNDYVPLKATQFGMKSLEMRQSSTGMSGPSLCTYCRRQLHNQFVKTALFVLWLQHPYLGCWCQRSDVEVVYVGTEDMLAVVRDTQLFPFLTVWWFKRLCPTSDSSWSRERYCNEQRSSVSGIAHAQTSIQPLSKTQLTFSREDSRFYGKGKTSKKLCRAFQTSCKGEIHLLVSWVSSWLVFGWMLYDSLHKALFKLSFALFLLAVCLNKHATL
jgi:hypothetical protein